MRATKEVAAGAQGPARRHEGARGPHDGVPGPGGGVHSPEAAIEWLSHFQPDELAEVLNRWDLPTGGTRAEQLEALENALRSGKAPATDRDRLEAMRRFTHLNLDEQREFARRCGLTLGGNQMQVLQEIEEHLGPKVPIETAFDYIDERCENGGQHVFLFRLEKGQAARLADPDEVLERVRSLRSVPDHALGDRKLVQDNVYKPLTRETLFFETVTESGEPVMAAAYWRDDRLRPEPGKEPGRALTAKWVATRKWHQFVHAARNPTRLDLSERSVSFFSVDCGTGEAELRIQRLNANPELPLREEYERLRRQVDRLLAAEALRPVQIEPAIRRLLTSTMARVVRWKVSWTDSGRLGGGVDPAMVRSLFRRFKNYSADGLAAEWLFGAGPTKSAEGEATKAGQPVAGKGVVGGATGSDEEEAGDGAEGRATRRVKVKLDALTNEVLVQRRCTSYEMQVVLADVRGGSSKGLRTPELERMARKRDAWRPVLQQIERSIGGVQVEKEVDLVRMARESWTTEELALEVAEELSKAYPRLFRLRIRALCPTSGKRAEDTDGRPVAFSCRAEIPKTFRCLHSQPRSLEEHDTAGNLEPVLISTPEPSGGGVLDRLRPKIEARLGDSADVFMSLLALLAFAILFSGVTLSISALFLLVSRAFGGGIGVASALSAPFGLVMLLLAGVVVKALGGPVTRMAVALLDHVTAIFDPRRGRQETVWPAEVHTIPEVGAKAEPKGGAEADQAVGEDAKQAAGAGAKQEAGAGGEQAAGGGPKKTAGGFAKQKVAEPGAHKEAPAPKEDA